MPEPIQISLAAARVNARLTQEEAAKRMKIGKRTIINWEKGAAIPSFAAVSYTHLDVYKRQGGNGMDICYRK